MVLQGPHLLSTDDACGPLSVGLLHVKFYVDSWIKFSTVLARDLFCVGQLICDSLIFSCWQMSESICHTETGAVGPGSKVYLYALYACGISIGCCCQIPGGRMSIYVGALVHASSSRG